MRVWHVLTRSNYGSLKPDALGHNGVYWVFKISPVTLVLHWLWTVNEWYLKCASEASSNFHICWAIWLKFVYACGVDILQYISINIVNISQFTAHRTLFAGLWPAPMPLLSAVSAGCSSPKKPHGQSSSQPKKMVMRAVYILLNSLKKYRARHSRFQLKQLDAKQCHVLLLQFIHPTWASSGGCDKPGPSLQVAFGSFGDGLYHP